MRQQPSPLARCRLVAPAAEHDVRTRGVCERPNRLRRLRGFLVAENTHTAEVEAEARLEEGAAFRIERPSGGGSRRRCRLVPRLIQCACFGDWAAGRMQNLLGDTIRLRFQRIVDGSNREPGLYFGATREIARRLFLVATMRRISGDSRETWRTIASERLIS